MVACYEFLETFVGCAAPVSSIARNIVLLNEWDERWQPWLWALIYTVYILVQAYGGRFFWNSLIILAVGPLLLATIYLLGSVKHANFQEHAPWPGADDEFSTWFRGGLFIFVRFVPAACNGFTCIECVNLACKDCVNPKRDIPRGYVSSVCSQAFFCLAAIFMVVSLPPGIKGASKAGAPLDAGFRLIFDCSAKTARAISITALCASAYGRLFSYGRQLSAMGNSGMVHPLFGKELHVKNRRIPLVALIGGSVMSFAVCLTSYYNPESVTIVQLGQLAFLGAFASYLAQMCSYIQFSGTFSIITREFRSPLGVYGAYYAMFWFALCWISISFFQKDHFAITYFAIYTGATVVYYFAVVQFTQVFSDEEKAILFRAHLIKSKFVFVS